MFHILVRIRILKYEIQGHGSGSRSNQCEIKSSEFPQMLTSIDSNFNIVNVLKAWLIRQFFQKNWEDNTDLNPGKNYGSGIIRIRESF